jgi:hypothetical protein
MVAGLLAAGAGIAGGLGDYFGGKDAAKAQEQFLQALLKQSTLGFNEALWGQFAQKQKKSIKAADKIAGKQYKAQRRHLGSQLHQQLSDIKAGGQQGQADAAQLAANRGLYNTTVLDSLNRGISSDVARQSGQARAQYGGALAALEGQKFGTQQQTQANLANLYGGKGATQLQGSQQKLGLMQAVGPIQEPSILGSLGTGLQAGMGAFDLAGGFGGGGMDFGQMLSQGVSGQYGPQMALKMMLGMGGLG